MVLTTTDLDAKDTRVGSTLGRLLEEMAVTGGDVGRLACALDFAKHDRVRVVVARVVVVRVVVVRVVVVRVVVVRVL